MLSVNEFAPDFSLPSSLGKEVSPINFQGKWMVIFFYPLSFTGTCGSELPEFNRLLESFKKLNAEVLAINTDSTHTHKAWVKELGGIDYPLLSDYKKEVSEKFGVLNKDTGVAYRATFIVNPEGKIKHASINDLPIARNVSEVLRILAALQSGGACPIGWTFEELMG